MCFRAFISFTLVLFLWTAPTLSFAVTTAAYEGFLVRIWQTEDGLPQNTVTSIAQSRDGYLWAGTYAGLARFDGERFHTFDVVTTPRLADERIASLYEDKAGTLWIGNESGRTFRYRNDHFDEAFASVHQQPRASFITEDDHGAVWIFRSDGSFAPVDRVDSVRPNPAGAPEKVLSFARGREGQNWISVSGVARELRGVDLKPIDFGPVHHSGYVRALGAASDGGAWVVRDGRIKKWLGEKWTDDRGAWGEGDITSLLELRNGALAIGTMQQGVELRYPDGRTVVFDYNHCGLQNWIRALFEDREGNLWIAAGSGGLAMVRATAFGVLNPPDRWQGRTVLSVTAGKSGELWIGTEGAGIYRFQSGEWTHYDWTNGLIGLYIWSLVVDDSGTLWAGTWDHGIFKLQGDRFVPAVELGPILSPVLAMQFSGDSLWVGTHDGLLRSHAGENIWSRRGGDEKQVIVDFATDNKGTSWLALQDQGLARMTPNGIEKLTPDQGLSADSAQCLLADGDTLWIGTQNGGLSRLKAGKVSQLGPRMHLSSRVICHIEDDGRGYLWLSTHRGIVRVAKRELNDCADGRTASVASEIFDQNDGLPTLEYSGGLRAAGCRTADGRLWFASNRGVASVNPAELPLNTLPPPILIESILVDGKRLFDPTAHTHLTVPPEHERIEIEYTALSLAASGKVRFKYKLDGVEKEWIDAGGKRTAFYSHLPPGNYKFQVIACNNDGVWNLAGESIALTVRPFYWQTWWFRTFAGLFAASAIGILVRQETHRRLQHRFDELEYERGIERERTRIAQDLHDDIGSTLTRISMLSQTSPPELQAPERAASVLKGINTATLEVTQTLDEIVWAVNPRHDRLDSLVCYISRLAQETLAEAGVACHTDLPLHLPSWRINASVRHNILLAFKEVLNNILKHSHATQVQISLVLHRAGFTLSIEDNGKCQTAAFEGETSPRALGGNGLENVKQRLSEIGGRCEIVTIQDKGWKVIFTLNPLIDA